MTAIKQANSSHLSSSILAPNMWKSREQQRTGGFQNSPSHVTYETSRARCSSARNEGALIIFFCFPAAGCAHQQRTVHPAATFREPAQPCQRPALAIVKICRCYICAISVGLLYLDRLITRRSIRPSPPPSKRPFLLFCYIVYTSPLKQVNYTPICQVFLALAILLERWYAV